MRVRQALWLLPRHAEFCARMTTVLFATVAAYACLGVLPWLASTEAAWQDALPLLHAASAPPHTSGISASTCFTPPTLHTTGLVCCNAIFFLGCRPRSYLCSSFPAQSVPGLADLPEVWMAHAQPDRVRLAAQACRIRAVCLATDPKVRGWVGVSCSRCLLFLPSKPACTATQPEISECLLAFLQC